MAFWRCSLALCVALLLAAVPCGAVDEQFSFYGLRLGMSRAAAGGVLPLQNGLVKNPGHGMSNIELAFDREDQLMEIRASWPRPDDPLQFQGLLRALREMFVAPANAKFPTVAVTLDEYGNRAAVQLVFLSSSLREKNIDFHKNSYLKTMK